MSSPTKIQASPKGIREGTRVILREITATLNNSPPSKTQMSGNEASKKSTPEHEVKVKFAREFADAEIYPPAVCPTTIITPVESNSISTASSFQSLTSTLSTKSSSGICVDSPSRSNDNSYNNLNDTGLDDLISACARIRLEDSVINSGDQSFGDVTFASATDELQLDRTLDVTRSGTVSPVEGNATQTINTPVNDAQTVFPNSPSSCDLNSTWNTNTPTADTNVLEIVQNNATLNTSAEQISPEYSTAPDLHTNFSIKSPVNESNVEPSNCSHYLEAIESSVTNNSQVLISPPISSDDFNNSEFKKPLPIDDLKVSKHVLNANIVSLDSLESNKFIETPLEIPTDSTFKLNETISLEAPGDLENINSLAIETNLDKIITENISTIPVTDNISDHVELITKTPEIFVEGTKIPEIEISEANEVRSEPVCELESTLLVDGINFTSSSEDLQESLNREAELKEKQETDIPVCPVIEGLNLPNDYVNFTPQRQSTSLVSGIIQPDTKIEESFKNLDLPESKFFDVENAPPLDPPLDFDQLNLETENIIKDIHNSFTGLETEKFVPASPDQFCDPSQFDFLLAKTENCRGDRLRSDSLFTKFDPLVAETSMLPQGNGTSPPPSNDERNGEKDTSLPNNITPKRNPAIAAIDRLLFYSPMTPDNIKIQVSEKKESVEKTESPVPVVDSAMASELELVRSTVLQLEEQLEKQKQSYEKQSDEKDKKNKSLQEMVAQLQRQLTHEIQLKDEMTAIVDEHEKSISRLVAEREKSRNDLDTEKAFLLRELADTKKHLEASEASFNDVHAKYEKIKQTMTMYTNNEVTLRESLENNVEVMKGLQSRYEQIKLHAATRLEKANQDLEMMQKQHESEIIKLRAMLKKEELKCNSLTEMIDQKAKENKELTKILDDVIARVNPNDK
ncbi:GSCOCG00001088001-RA-CDS [Cotesia congregata]|uniref:Similar to tacc3: Transforming acidic coiled-coil-containing protein 3 (Xenopus laevis) n=1 Tax=Cotesia congregata TaxID=51543 RepID=A0A8J2HDR3_COTCN|nr:GSCOCG00001088001-RA-CDS [Cotesia congregata]CAG5096095.1 Similar to tacc3: Transforming acidic coiled-coil-containing protein 3 (Xenopus laevis) [Cotesia congregata]